MNCLPASTIFVVDDAPGIRIYLEYILRRAGYRVEVFVNAQTFLDRPRFDGVGCLVLAIHMPGITGLELQKKLGREGNHIPIIFITQSRDVDEAVESMKQGAFDFFTKPFNVKKLLAAICKALKAHRMLRQELAVTTDAHNLIATLTPFEKLPLPSFTAASCSASVSLTPYPISRGPGLR